jgi:sugar transferase (PEP-CTERM/EpsH1 system associated)
MGSEPLLFLTHRIPFPPNKGDKVRSYHLLKHLGERYRVHLGTFVDDESDAVHVQRVAPHCATLKAVAMRPSVARLRSAAGLWMGEPLTLPYYRDASLAKWVDAVLRAEAIRKVVVFSSSMAQYVVGRAGLRTVVDFVDVDSAKWEQYSHSRRWPLASIYGREGRRLLAFERAVAASSHASVFVSEAEARLFARLAPECAARVHCVPNGVDGDFYSPEQSRGSPFTAQEEPIVFTGAMDYWPNVDAVTWFAREILPSITRVRPRARFYVVGMRPTPPVLALARDARVTVTGTVADVRPYVQHARVVVAPMRVARGIQNKVLEGMAMGRPVVVSAAAAAGLPGTPGTDFDVAADAGEFASATAGWLAPGRDRERGAAARACVLANCAWPSSLARFDALLDGGGAERAACG